MTVTAADVVVSGPSRTWSLARQAVRRLAQELGFGVVDQTKLVTAASELARNAVVYGRGGEMRWEKLSDGPRAGLRLHFVDEGPGIPDLKLALTDGWTSGRGLGLGFVRRAAAGQRFRDRHRTRPWNARERDPVE